MKLFSPINLIVRESVLTVPYINIGGQWDSSHHKLSQVKGTVKGQMGQFKNLPHKNLSLLKGQKSKKRHVLTAQELCKKKHLSPHPGTVQNGVNVLSQKGEGNIFQSHRSKGSMPSIKGYRPMDTKSISHHAKALDIKIDITTLKSGVSTFLTG